jgi:hypothetical protein
VAKGKGGPRDGVNQQTMPPAEQCAERRTLWSRLVDATTEVYRAKNAYDFVKEKQVESLDALRTARERIHRTDANATDLQSSGR